MIHKIRSLYPADYNFDYLYDRNMNYDCRGTTNIIIIISLSNGWGILTSKEGPEGGTPAEFEELPRPGVGVQLLLLHHIITEVTN